MTRKQTVATFSLLVVACAGMALAQKSPSTRTIRGQVLGPDEKPVFLAVVHLKNEKTKEVLSVITDKEGRYAFADLPLRSGYELYAEFEELRSRTRHLSSLDTRTRVFINFRLQKPEKKPRPAKKETEPDR